MIMGGVLTRLIRIVIFFQSVFSDHTHVGLMEEISCGGSDRTSDFIAIRIVIVDILGYIEMCMISVFRGS